MVRTSNLGSWNGHWFFVLMSRVVKLFLHIMRHNMHSQNGKTEDRNKTNMSIKSLSIYCILTMHVMFHDVKEQFNDPRHQKKNQNINFQEMLYADDTLIFAKSARTANAYLHLIEQESEYLHLRLNHDKCNYISFNTWKARTFWDS